MRVTSRRIVGGDQCIEAVSVDTDNLFGSVGRDTQYRSGVGRDTDNLFGRVGRDTQYRGGVGRRPM